MDRLDRITQFFIADTHDKRLPGAVVMVAHHGKVIYHEAFGLRDPTTGAPMQKDSIFRMYSMTKPVTGVAVLMLLEDGKLRLSDPVSKYLPALKNPKGAVETVDAQGRRAAAASRLRPAARCSPAASNSVRMIPTAIAMSPSVHAGQQRITTNVTANRPKSQGRAPGVSGRWRRGFVRWPRDLGRDDKLIPLDRATGRDGQGDTQALRGGSDTDMEPKLSR